MTDVKAKKVEFGVEGSKFVVKVDPNADGEALLKVELDLTEVPDEIAAIFIKGE